MPPLDADVVGEHTVEADSHRVRGVIALRDELWDACHSDLIAKAELRLAQEIERLNGSYAHIYDEGVVPKRDAATDEAWLHGRFDYVLYRRTPAANAVDGVE